MKKHFWVSRLVLIVITMGAIGTVWHPAHITHARATLQIIASVGGKPDDITMDPQGRLVWGDLARGTINRLVNGKVVTLFHNLGVPEGIVALGHGAFLVAEQSSDRIDRIDRKGTLTVLYHLQPVPGQDGVDGIGFDARTDTVLIPNSPRGTLLGLSLRTHRVHVIAQGLGRPVEATVDTHGNILVPDEHLGTLVVISPRGHISYRGQLATPDDVVVDRSNRIWVTTLGDGGLWMLAPGAAPRRILVGLLNPQGLTLDRCGNPIVVEQNAARIVRLVLSTAARRCLP
ncbi:MAG: hypothetical protein NVSMB52_00020 [Chloroflexota bacterium]